VTLDRIPACGRGAPPCATSGTESACGLVVHFLVLLVLAHLGCAGSSVGQEGSFCLSHDCYQLGRLGPSWQVVQRQEGGIGFFSAEVGGVIESNAVCRKDVEAVPLQSLTDHLLIGYTDRKVRSAETVPLVRREALRTILDVKLDGVPMVLDLYVFKRNGCVFDLSFAAAPAGYERGAVDFQRFVGGFIPARS
jgi:hypothetical protein